MPPELRAQLLEQRAQRVRPGTDDKRLTRWNALMVSALADAGAVLERDDYLDAARAAADFLLTTMADGSGGCCAPTTAARPSSPGCWPTTPSCSRRSSTLYEATFEERWFAAARDLAATLIDRFADRENGGFCSTPPDHGLLARRKDLEDTPIPAGGSAAAFGLLRLAALTGDHALAEPALGMLALVHEAAPRYPTAFGHLLQAIDFHLAPTREVALVGDDLGPLARDRALAAAPAPRARRRPGQRRHRRAAAGGTHAGERTTRRLRV